MVHCVQSSVYSVVYMQTLAAFETKRIYAYSKNENHASVVSAYCLQQKLTSFIPNETISAHG